MKAKGLLILGAGIALVIFFLVRSPRGNSGRLETNRTEEPTAGAVGLDATSVGQPTPRPSRSGNQSGHAAQADKNMTAQERLQELAQWRGVSLTDLTQQLVAEFSNGFSQGLNGPIEFYGRAVDESGSGVGGAT